MVLLLTLADEATPTRAWPRANGAFAFYGVPEGVHNLEVSAPGLLYPQVRGWWTGWRCVAWRNDPTAPDPPVPSRLAPPSPFLPSLPKVRLAVGPGGAVRATFADDPAKPLPVPLALRPLSRLAYFDARAGFDPVAFLKTPCGILALFVAFAVFALPHMKIDPEEYEELLGGGRGRPDAAGAPGGGEWRWWDAPAQAGVRVWAAL